MNRYKAHIKTSYGGYVCRSGPMENMKEAVLAFIDKFGREMEKDDVLSVEFETYEMFEIFGGNDDE